MLRLFLNRRGAVSVFLVLVLVPMLVFSAVTVDVSRVSLGKAMAVSAGDLTANTILTNYDYRLKEMYGLMASANDCQDFLDKMEQFYADTIQASGLEEEDARLLAGDAVALVESADLQNIKIEQGAVKATVLEDQKGSLMNPAVTKTQIVNFMKYRAPIHMGTSIFEAVNLFKNMGKKTKLIEKKNTYYEKHADILELCQKARDRIGDYESQFLSKEGDHRDMKTALDNLAGQLNTILENYMPDLYSYSYFKDPKTNRADLKYNTSSGKWVWSGAVWDGRPCNPGRVEKLLENLEQYRSSSNQQYQKYVNVRMDEVCVLEQLFREYSENKGYLKLCSNLFYCLKKLKDDDEFALPDNGGTTTKEEFLKDRHNDYFKVLKRVLDVYDGNKSRVAQEWNSLNNVCNSIRTQTNNYLTQLDNQIDCLTGGNGVTAKLNDIKSKLGKLNDARNSWNNAAAATELQKDTMAQSDKQEINRLKDTFDSGQIDSLVARVNKAADSLKKARDEICKYKLGDKAFSSFSGDSSVIAGYCTNTLRGNYSDTQMKYPTASELQSMTAAIKSGVKKGNISVSWSGDNSPELSKPQKKEFYEYLINNYQYHASEDAGKKKAKIETDEKQYSDKTKEKQAQANQTVIVNTARASDLANRPSKNWSGGRAENNVLGTNTEMGSDKKNMLGASSSLMDTMFAGVVDRLEGARDNFYLSDYILNMFSYSTIENEWSDKGKSGEPLSMTKTPVNAANNVLHGKEVEYILYGDMGVAKAYASIYGIRFAANVIYAFTDSSITSMASTVAASICGAPPLTALMPLVKIAIVVGVALLESALDMVDLSAGKKVPLYKTKESWQVSPGNAVGTVVDRVADPLIDTGAALLDEWICSKSEDLSVAINEGEEEFTKAVNQMVDDTMDSYVTSAVEEFTSICSNVIANNVGNAEQYVKNELNKWRAATDFGSSEANAVRDAAVEALCSGNYTEQMIEKIKSGSQSAVEHLTKTVHNGISAAVKTAGAGIEELKNTLVAQMREAAKNGAEEMKKTLKNKLGEKFGTNNSKTSVSGTDTAMGSLLSWRYSDYLRLFLVIGSMANENNILLRTEDIIQANMAKAKGNNNYQLRNSFVYFELKAEVLVDPLLTTIPLIYPHTKDKLRGKNWYTIEYSTKFGY